MKTEMKVLLYIKRGGQDKDGFSPLMGRISIKGKVNSIAQFACKFKKSMCGCGTPQPKALHGQKQGGDNGKQGD